MKKNYYSGIIALAIYSVIACILTFPLIFRLNSTVYGFYDHISTDMFAVIHSYFWWPTTPNNPFVNQLSTFPFGSRMFFVNATGFVMAPVSMLIGYLASRNIVILANLILSALGMFFLVRYITKNAGAGFIAGIIFAFCPNMLVRSYTTFDSTQVQWIPFYTLYLIKFFEKQSWRNAILVGVFMLCNILFTMPYYLVYLPIHTFIFLAIYVRHIPKVLPAWRKIVVIFTACVVIFTAYYTYMVGGTTYTSTVIRTTEQLRELALKPMDYLVPHPRSTFLSHEPPRSLYTTTDYWNICRPGKDPDSFVAYIGYIAIILAAIGFLRSKNHIRWFFLASIIIAFWSTVSVYSPSYIIHIYATFARRILLYKTFLQFGVAGLAGIGTAIILKGGENHDL